jgi:hypothetical protein
VVKAAAKSWVFLSFLPHAHKPSRPIRAQSSAKSVEEDIFFDASLMLRKGVEGMREKMW